MTLEDLEAEIQTEIEWLENTHGEDIECISIENLEGILSRYFEKEIKLSLE